LKQNGFYCDIFVPKVFSAFQDQEHEASYSEALGPEFDLYHSVGANTDLAMESLNAGMQVSLASFIERNHKICF
jgi:hypothetical protein